MARQATVSNIGIRGRVTEEGFLVTKVEAPVSAAGLEEGDVILSIMGYPVCNDVTWERLVSGDNQYVRLGILDRTNGDQVTRYCRLASDRRKKA